MVAAGIRVPKAEEEAVLFNCATGLKYPPADRSATLAKGGLPDLVSL